MMKEKDLRCSKAILSNILTYVGFLIIALVGIYYGRSIQGIYPEIRLWTLENVVTLCLAFPFLFIFGRARIPDFFDKSVSMAQRWYLPLALGAVFGILDVLVIKVCMHPEPYVELPPFLQPFPYSLFLYFSGAFEVEVFYRLIPMTLILWLGANYKEGLYFHRFFWVGAMLTALREPLEQWPAGETWYITYAFCSGFLMNLLQAVFFKKYGFLASLILRLGHYLVWHILLGVYVQFVELL